jgi:hypothetical protein
MAYYTSLNGGEGFSPIGNQTVPFTGAYDGQNHTISNLYINRSTTDDIGLFGFTFDLNFIPPPPPMPDQIKNLGLLDVNITGHDNVGSLGGWLYASKNCYSTGSINGNSYLGGIAGWVAFSSDCYSTCNVTGTGDNIGGFGGDNQGNIYNCYSTGSVTGSNQVGGFIGYNDGAVLQFCYSTGSVSGTSDVGGLVGYNNGGSSDDCFWNTETSGQVTSAGGEGRTTAEMKRVGTYLSDPSLFNPWDFTFSSGLWGFNGMDNDGYPFLRLQGYAPGNIWLGTNSSDWDDSGNWSESNVPSVLDKVFIPDVLNDPILSTLAEIPDMTIELGGYLNIASTGRLTVTGVLSNEAGFVGLVLEPDASAIIGYSPIPDATVKRNIPKDAKWHFLACPVTTALMPLICDGNFAPLTSDFNASSGATYDFFYWKEPPASSNLNWISLKKPDWSPNYVNFEDPPRFEVGKGYLVEYSSSFAGDAMKSFTGELGSGSYGIPVTYTSGGNWSGYNLLANPYSSSVDWKNTTGWTRNVLKTVGGGKNMWIWNDATGNYGVYNSGLSGNTGTNGVSRYIPPTQAFFVQAVSSGSVLMTEEVQCHSTQGWLKSDDQTLKIGVTSSATTYSDEVLLSFNSLSNGGADKLFSFYDEAPALYLPVDNNNYSIRFINEVGSNHAIPVSLKAGIDGNYTLKITGTEGFTNVYLQDLKTGAMQDVKAQPAYTFLSSTADDVNRFLIRFTPLGIELKQSEQDIFIYNNVLNVNNPGNAVITVYNMTGIKVTEKQTNNEPIFRLPLQLQTGYYLVKVTNGTSILSEKVFVK